MLLISDLYISWFLVIIHPTASDASIKQQTSMFSSGCHLQMFSHQSSIALLGKWCQQNPLILNTGETKELMMDPHSCRSTSLTFPGNSFWRSSSYKEKRYWLHRFIIWARLICTISFLLNMCLTDVKDIDEYFKTLNPALEAFLSKNRPNLSTIL